MKRRVYPVRAIALSCASSQREALLSSSGERMHPACRLRRSEEAEGDSGGLAGGRETQRTFQNDQHPSWRPVTKQKRYVLSQFSLAQKSGALDLESGGVRSRGPRRGSRRGHGR